MHHHSNTLQQGPSAIAVTKVLTTTGEGCWCMHSSIAFCIPDKKRHCEGLFGRSGALVHVCLLQECDPDKLWLCNI
eukprot:330935-Amphidinium_carterae.1